MFITLGKEFNTISSLFQAKTKQNETSTITYILSNSEIK